MTYSVQQVGILYGFPGGGGVKSGVGAGLPATFSAGLLSFWNCTATNEFGTNLLGTGLSVILTSTAFGGNSAYRLQLWDNGVHSAIGDIYFTIRTTGRFRGNYLLSFDTATHSAQMYWNDIPLVVASAAWYSTNAMSTAGNIYRFGSIQNSPPILAGYGGDVWFSNTASFVDLSVVSNRRKFINADATPVDLGSSGQNPFGTSPPIFLHCLSTGAPADFYANNGTGGAWALDKIASLSFDPADFCNPWLPLVPTDLGATSPTSSTLTASWTAPESDTLTSGSVPNSYTLRYRVSPSGGWTQITGITGTSQLVSGLSPATAYDFEVESVNGQGVSGFSSPVTSSTASTLPPTPPVVVPASLGRWRGACGINWNGLALVGDAFSNVVGLSDFAIFEEYGNRMEMLVTSPPLHDNRKRIFVTLFEIEMEAGQETPGDPSAEPGIIMDYSKDGGVTWITLQQFRSMGKVGQYIKRLRWINVGNSRTWVFRLRYSDQVRPVIIGTYLDSYKGLG